MTDKIKFTPEGYGEWQTVKVMTDKGYKGCRWTRIPTWGYVNEADNDLSTVIWSGVVTPEIFSNICDRTIEKYFSRENYYMIDGCPVYMIF